MKKLIIGLMLITLLFGCTENTPEQAAQDYGFELAMPLLIVPAENPSALAGQYKMIVPTQASEGIYGDSWKTSPDYSIGASIPNFMPGSPCFIGSGTGRNPNKVYCELVLYRHERDEEGNYKDYEVIEVLLSASNPPGEFEELEVENIVYKTCSRLNNCGIQMAPVD